MTRILKLILTTIGGLFLLLASLQALSVENSMGKPAQPTATQVLPSPTPIAIEKAPNIDDLPFQDNPDVYQYDDPSSVVTMYVTVRKGISSDNSDYTWKEVNDFNKWIYGSRSANLVVGKAEVIVQIGDESGPLPGELGYEAVVPNATIQIRGASSSAMPPPKSYKIEFNKNADKWRGQSTLALNKHIFDSTRVRNKLNFDLMKQIPNLVSLRTQFVHLYVKDQTIDLSNSKFVDYGLFTQVEQVNKQFLENHLLDRNAQLYKATSFEFYRYSDQIRMADDPLYDEVEFSHRLEIKGNGDHSKLIQMLDDINNYDIPIEQSFEKYFDAENYFTWMAYNILIGSIDTQNQNFFLYSPHNGNKWYFLPWDYDSTFNRQQREFFLDIPFQYWEAGISNYWGGVLHNRVLRSQTYRRMLDDKITELMRFLTPERIEGMLNTYRPVAESYISRLPDKNAYLFGVKNEFKLRYALMPSEVQYNYVLYLESLKQPMPFYLGTPIRSGDILRFNWDEAYNFEPQDVTYHFEVSKDIDFNDIIYEEDLVNLTTTDTELFEPGAYCWRVIVTNQSGKIQYPFDSYFDADPDYPHVYDGVKLFTITPDGQVIE